MMPYPTCVAMFFVTYTNYIFVGRGVTAMSFSKYCNQSEAWCYLYRSCYTKACTRRLPAKLAVNKIRNRRIIYVYHIHIRWKKNKRTGNKRFTLVLILLFVVVVFRVVWVFCLFSTCFCLLSLTLRISYIVYLYVHVCRMANQIK